MYSNTQARGKTVSRSDSRYIYSLLYQGILAVFSKEVEVYHMITFSFVKTTYTFKLIPLYYCIFFAGAQFRDKGTGISHKT